MRRIFVIAVTLATFFAFGAAGARAQQEPESHGACTFYVGTGTNGCLMLSAGTVNSWSWASTSSHAIRTENAVALVTQCLPSYAYLKLRYLDTSGAVISQRNSAYGACSLVTGSSNGLYAKAQCRIVSTAGGVSRSAVCYTRW